MVGFVFWSGLNFPLMVRAQGTRMRCDGRSVLSMERTMWSPGWEQFTTAWSPYLPMASSVTSHVRLDASSNSWTSVSSKMHSRTVTQWSCTLSPAEGIYTLHLLLCPSVKQNNSRDTQRHKNHYPLQYRPIEPLQDGPLHTTRSFHSRETA